MIAALASLTLLIIPSPHTDIALSCVDPGSHTPYRVAARLLDRRAVAAMPNGTTYVLTPKQQQDWESDDWRGDVEVIGWVFVRRADAVCTEITDHQSHASH